MNDNDDGGSDVFAVGFSRQGPRPGHTQDTENLLRGVKALLLLRNVFLLILTRRSFVPSFFFFFSFTLPSAFLIISFSSS